MTSEKNTKDENKHGNLDEVSVNEKSNEFVEVKPTRCSSKVPFDSCNDKQDGTSDLGVLGEPESIYESTDINIGTLEESKPSSFSIERAIEHYQPNGNFQGSETRNIVDKSGEEMVEHLIVDTKCSMKLSFESCNNKQVQNEADLYELQGKAVMDIQDLEVVEGLGKRKCDKQPGLPLDAFNRATNLFVDGYMNLASLILSECMGSINSKFVSLLFDPGGNFGPTSTRATDLRVQMLVELLSCKIAQAIQRKSDHEAVKLKLEYKVTSMNYRQLPNDASMLEHLPMRFWELNYVSNNQNFKLSPEVRIVIGLEEITWLTGAVVILNSFLDDSRNLTCQILGDCMIHNHSVDVITLLLFDPGGSHAFQNSGDYPLSHYCILFKYEGKSGESTDAKRFGNLNLSPELLKSLYIKLKLEKPSVIQAETFPVIIFALPYGNLKILAFDEADHMVAEDGLQPLNLGLLFHISIPFDLGGIVCFLNTWNSDSCTPALIELETKCGEQGLAYMHDNSRLHQGLGPSSVAINTMVVKDATFLVHMLLITNDLQSVMCSLWWPGGNRALTTKCLIATCSEVEWEHKEIWVLRFWTKNGLKTTKAMVEQLQKYGVIIISSKRVVEVIQIIDGTTPYVESPMQTL